MRVERQRLHRRRRDRQAGRGGAREQGRLDPQPGRGRRAPQVAQQRVPGPQRLARPVQADRAEQPVLDRVPFRAAGRVVADRHGQPEPVAQVLLHLLLPQPGPIAVAAPAVGQDQQARGPGIGRPARLQPPAGERGDGELGRVARRPDGDRAALGRHDVAAVGDGPPERVVAEVMDVDRRRLPAPGAPGVLEIADRCLFLGVDADDWQPRRLEGPALGGAVGALGGPVGVARPGLDPLGVDTERVLQPCEQPPDGLVADHMPRLGQPAAQLAQAAAHLLRRAHRVAGRLGLHQRLQGGQDRRIFFQPVGDRHQGGAPARAARRSARRPVRCAPGGSSARPGPVGLQGGVPAALGFVQAAQEPFTCRWRSWSGWGVSCWQWGHRQRQTAPLLIAYSTVKRGPTTPVYTTPGRCSLTSPNYHCTYLSMC